MNTFEIGSRVPVSDQLRFFLSLHLVCSTREEMSITSDCDVPGMMDLESSAPAGQSGTSAPAVEAEMPVSSSSPEKNAVGGADVPVSRSSSSSPEKDDEALLAAQASPILSRAALIQQVVVSQWRAQDLGEGVSRCTLTASSSVTRGRWGDLFKKGG